MPPGMGRDLYEAYPSFRAVMDSAPVDFDLKKLCFEGPEETLSQTQYTQPCMVAFAAGVTAVLYEKGIHPTMAAGLSLGEGHGRGRKGPPQRHGRRADAGPGGAPEVL